MKHVVIKAEDGAELHVHFNKAGIRLSLIHEARFGTAHIRITPDTARDLAEVLNRFADTPRAEMIERMTPQQAQALRDLEDDQLGGLGDD